MSKNLIIVLIVLLALGIGAGIYFSQEGVVEKEEAEEVSVPEEEITVKEELPVYKGATEFKLSSEMEENIRKGSEFPESTRMVAYATEDAPDQVYQWYRQELRQQGWEVIDIGEGEDILWKKDNKILMLGIMPVERAKEMGVEKNLIFHMTDEYSNWEDFLMEEFDIISEEKEEEKVYQKEGKGFDEAIPITELSFETSEWVGTWEGYNKSNFYKFLPEKNQMIQISFGETEVADLYIYRPPEYTEEKIGESGRDRTHTFMASSIAGYYYLEVRYRESTEGKGKYRLSVQRAKSVQPSLTFENATEITPNTWYQHRGVKSSKAQAKHYYKFYIEEGKAIKIINWGSTGVYFDFYLLTPDGKDEGDLVFKAVEGEYRLKVIEEEPTTERGEFSYHFLIKVGDWPL